MDPNGGNNPSAPRLDNNSNPQPGVTPGVPSQQPFTPEPPRAPIIPTPVDPTPAQPATPFNPTTTASPMAPPANLDGDGGLNISSESKGPIDGKGKTVVFIVLGVILIVGVAAAAFFVGNTMGKSAGKKVATAEYQKQLADAQRQQAEEDAQQEEESKLDLGTELVDPEYVDENVEGDIGKQLTASDGLVIKVTNIERNFKTDDPNYKLDSTKELVKVNFLMGNIAKDKAKDITNFAFYLENSANARLTPESIAGYTDKFDTVKLDPGSQAKGSIVYLVNKDETPLKFIREQRYRFSGENREVTTRTIVNVAE